MAQDWDNDAEKRGSNGRRGLYGTATVGVCLTSQCSTS